MFKYEQEKAVISKKAFFLSCELTGRLYWTDATKCILEQSSWNCDLWVKLKINDIIMQKKINLTLALRE